MNDQDIPVEWVGIGTEAIAKQRRVDQMLRQVSKDEWFAKSVIAAVTPLIAAAERAKAARDVAERLLACKTCGKPHAERVIVPATDKRGAETNWADPDDGHSYRFGSLSAYQVWTVARAYADEQARPGGGDDA